MRLRRLVLASCFTASAAAASVVAACSSASSASTSPTNDVGTVAAAVTAVGADGATYSFPSGAYLQLLVPGQTAFAGPQLYFSSQAGTETFSVPVGTYTATLQGVPNLVRLGDSGAATVAATLLDAQPYSIAVTAGQTTPIAISFSVPELGQVTFSTGNVATTLRVDAGAALPTRGTISGTYNVTTNDLTGPAALNSALNQTTAVSIPVSVSFNITGPFAAAVDSVCAPIMATVNVAISTTPGVPQNIEALIDEAGAVPDGGALNVSVGSLCLFDAKPQPNSVNTGGLQIAFERIGRATTPEMASLLNTGTTAPSEQFLVWLAGQLPTPLYDGKTLSLAPLALPLTYQAVLTASLTEINGAWAEVEAGDFAPTTVQLFP